MKKTPGSNFNLKLDTDLIYDLFSKLNNKSIANYLNPASSKQVNLNYLYHKN